MWIELHQSHVKLEGLDHSNTKFANSLKCGLWHVGTEWYTESSIKNQCSSLSIHAMVVILN